MPIVAVELPAPEPPAAMTRALLSACSSAVRDGRCILASDVSSEPRIAIAFVRFSGGAERLARIQVEMSRGGGSDSRARLLTFKDSDARVERWRSVGLTIATLVGDMLPPRSDSSDARESPAGAIPDESTSAPGGASKPSEPEQVEDRDAEKARREAEQREEQRRADERARDEAARRAEKDQARAAQEQHEVAPAHDSPGSSGVRSLWVGATGAAGPGLEEGGWRFGGGVDLGWKPTSLPAFARLSLGFAGRPADSRGLSVQWEAATLGGGAMIGGQKLRLEPRLAVSINNVHAAVSERSSSGKSSGNQLEAGVHGGLDLVFRLSLIGLVAGIDAWRTHAPTQIVVERRVVGVSPAAGWSAGIGVRVFLE